MTLESDAKLEEKLTCGLENDMRNLGNFRSQTEKINNFILESKMMELIRIKIQNKKIGQMQCGNFTLTSI